MPLISYAQNMEDVMLWRALQDVGSGFYIDIGANDPSEDSVTRGFYENGWHGINVEPVRRHWLDLCAARPRDINLHCAVGERNGEIEIHEADVRGQATASTDRMTELRVHGRIVRSYTVPMRSLAHVCLEHAPATIHFLKVDVEGFELEVLKGADFCRFRPWILVIEATAPGSLMPNHQAWEPMVIDSGYSFAYFDGLNRFYAAIERPELLDALERPPNVSDAGSFYLRPGHPFSYPLATAGHAPPLEQA